MGYQELSTPGLCTVSGSLRIVIANFRVLSIAQSNMVLRWMYGDAPLPLDLPNSFLHEGVGYKALVWYEGTTILPEDRERIEKSLLAGYAAVRQSVLRSCVDYMY